MLYLKRGALRLPSTAGTVCHANACGLLCKNGRFILDSFRSQSKWLLHRIPHAQCRIILYVTISLVPVKSRWTGQERVRSWRDEGNAHGERELLGRFDGDLARNQRRM